MVKKFARGIALLLVPVLLTAAALAGYDRYLNQQIDARYNSALGRTYGVDEMNKGLALLRHNAEKDDLILLGSSEMDAKVPQNPQYMFPNTELDSDVCLVGRAGVQSLLDAIKVGALDDSFRNKKIVLIVSLQWFLTEEIDRAGFQSHFSEVQFYEMMHNPDLSNEVKLYVAERVTSLVSDQPALKTPYVYASLYGHDNVVSKIGYFVMKPYYSLHTKFLKIKDKHESLKAVQAYEQNSDQQAKPIDWATVMDQAAKQGEEACTNNDWYVYDDYYTTYLEDRIVPGSSDNVDLMKSKEFDDYRIFLKVCTELDIKPYLVFMSTNGKYYDTIGIDKQERWAFYDRLGEMASEYDMDYLDLRDHEYEPYFFTDVMHLGWKGWTFVNEKITEYFTQGQ